MSDISDFEQRINAALERIGQGLDALSPADDADDAQDSVHAAALQSAQDALEAEKMANAQLEERVRAIREKQDSQVAQLETDVSDLRARNAEVEAELAGLKRVTAALRASNTDLRDANATGLGDAHLINKSMQAELETLRAQRDGDRAELDDVLATLAPLTEEASNA